VARQTITVDHYTYEGTDAHRTLLHVGELWAHHAHGREPSLELQRRCADALASLIAPLAGGDEPALSPPERIDTLGKRAAERIGLVDNDALVRALREMWSPLAALSTGVTDTDGVVAGLFLSDGGVPKSAVDTVEVGYRGVIGDRQATRVHHGRPWQALCLWSADVVASHAAAGHPIRPGSAGENVSLRGIDWTQVRPGVSMSVGTVEIVVTAYAIPCNKNARWFTDGDFERMSHERADQSRVYARVERPGRITVGDSARLVR
jgi:hypothetical protein